jgi:putative DNA primase/helicase
MGGAVVNDLTLVDTTNVTAIPTPVLIARPQDIDVLRLRLHANGYHPVPILGAHVDEPGAGKAPKLKDWAGYLVAPDIDVLNETVSAQVLALANGILGVTPLRRIGKAPKVLLV